MIEGVTYRHRNCTEVDMKINQIHAEESLYLKLSVTWINRHSPHITWDDFVTVKSVDLKNWSKV